MCRKIEILVKIFDLSNKYHNIKCWRFVVCTINKNETLGLHYYFNGNFEILTSIKIQCVEK